MKNLGEISFIVFQKKIILEIDERWLSHFVQNDIKFEAKIDKNGRFTLCGPHVKGFPQKTIMKSVDSDNG